MTSTDQPQKPAKKGALPKLRKDLAVAFNDYDIQGNPQWLIHDAGRNKFFLIGWMEYEIFERWHLGSMDAIVASINQETTLHAELADVENFILFLKRSYLIRMSGYDISKQATEQNLFKNDSIIHWLISNYLFFRIPLLHPDKFLEKTKPIADFIFSRYTSYVMTVLGLIAIYQLSNRWEQFMHTFPNVFTWQAIFFAMIIFVITKAAHELGHAYVCKSYGVAVPTFGIAFLVFWPVLYTDTTLSWSLNNRQRMHIALAGIWVETYITIFAALIWCNTDNQTLQTLCYIAITINWLASVLINVSPFMRFDGYYVLADYLKMPNLQFRAFALTRWQLRKWLFGWQDPPPEKFSTNMHYFLLVYSLITWIYRLMVYLGIALLVYYFFAKMVGIILFLVEIQYFILAPLIDEFKTWYALRQKFSFNINTKITLTVFSALIVLFFIPVKTTFQFPSTLRFAHEFLNAPEAGILVANLPPAGTKVLANVPIITIKSDQLTQAMRETQLEYEKTISQIRSASVNPEYLNQKSILVSDLKRLRAEYTKLINIQKKLSIRVPFNGILIETPADIRAGTYLSKGQWLGDVINPDKIAIEAYVSQIDINKIKVGTTGYFYGHNYSVPTIPVHVISIELINAKQLDCSYSDMLKQQKDQDAVIETPCYNASELGGEIPTYQADEGAFVPTTSVYRILLATDKPVVSNYVERGTVRLNTPSQSYASRVFYRIKSVLIEELGF